MYRPIFLISFSKIMQDRQCTLKELKRCYYRKMYKIFVQKIFIIHLTYYFLANGAYIKKVSQL